MAGSGSPCGACKFLRRKCVKGCVFAPYFSNEQGPTNFAAIHKIFGASNVSKLLTQIPVSDRSEAVVTISYEAQARVQDPIYGCVSHIFALQQQVVNLQSQLASLKEQAAECIINNSTITANPNDHKFDGDSHSSLHDPRNTWQSLQNQVTMPQFDAILILHIIPTIPENTKTRFSESRIGPTGAWIQLQVSSVISNGHFKMLEMSYSQLLLGTFIFLDESLIS